MSRWLHTFNLSGKVLVLFGLLALAPLLVSLALDDGEWRAFALTAALCIGTGAASILATRRTQGDLKVRHGFFLVLQVWVLLPLFGAIPILEIVDGITLTKAYFEAASGMTASGGTVLSGIDSLPPSLNFWRGELIWLGGMGLIVLTIAILPFLGVGGRQLLTTELPGPLKEQNLTPQITKTAKGLWLIYLSLTLLCMLSYWAAGMDWMDAMVHSMTTLALGGFSSHDASFAHFDSVAIETVSIVFMLVAGMNFATHFSAFLSRDLRAYWGDIEIKTFLGVILACVAIVTLFLWDNGEYGTFLESLRYGAFNTVSIATTTGYSNADFGAWPLFAPMLMLVMANFVACGGSTGGGIKMVRCLILFKQVGTERLKLLHPKAFYDTKFGTHALPNRVLVSVLFFVLAYFASALILMMLLLGTGMDFLTAFSAAVASISNTGPGLGGVGPASNYSELSDTQTWLCTFAMLLGRLEILAFMVVVHPIFWRK